jgi:hypothetical protein
MEELRPLIERWDARAARKVAKAAFPPDRTPK